MPHKCIRCGKTYASGSLELMKGCDCGSRVFVFTKKDEDIDLKKLAWLEQEFSELTKEKPVSLDLESAENVRVLEKGAYELNVKSLMEGNPLVIRSEKGVYYIKIPPLRKNK